MSMPFPKYASHSTFGHFNDQFGIFLYYFILLFHLLYTNPPKSITTGNIKPTSKPFFKSSPNAPDTNPTTVGPALQPTSPAKAKIANIAVPPRFSVPAAILNTPGHIIPTDKPQTAHAINEITALSTNDATMYVPIQRPALHKIKFINLI